MKCTECKKESDHLHCERWSSKHGYIINKNESLCDNCAGKRQGFKTLMEINNDFKRYKNRR